VLVANQENLEVVGNEAFEDGHQIEHRAVQVVAGHEYGGDSNKRRTIV